jgi:hypothetical protein
VDENDSAPFAGTESALLLSVSASGETDVDENDSAPFAGTESALLLSVSASGETDVDGV